MKEKYAAAVREGFLKLDVDLKGSMIPSVIIKFVLVCVDYAKLQQSQNDSHANIHQHKPPVYSYTLIKITSMNLLGARCTYFS